MGSIMSYSSGSLGSFGTSFVQRALTSVEGGEDLSKFLNFNPQSYLLDFIFNKNKQNEFSIKDVSLQTSTYGKIITKVFGNVKIAGNIIWSSPIYKNTIYHAASFGKSFSAKGEYETQVTCSFAIAICEGPITSLNAIYADDEIIDTKNTNLKIYLGNDNQKDPTIQSYFELDSIPNFKNLCYVVFTNFDLSKYGNRIPNFTFNITNNLSAENNSIQKLVKAINIIPGSGEFVYDTKEQFKLHGKWIFGKFFEEKRESINAFTSDDSNSITSLNNLTNTFSNLEWTSLVICWFCDNLNGGYAKIYPACEFKEGSTYPNEWKVGNFTRENARVVQKDSLGNIRYGGTPSDDSIVRYIKEIKNRNLKVAIYPMLMVDIEEKPWRGRIFAENKNGVDNFFNEYNQFILHYANLLKEDADAFIIGSEMVNLTSFQDNKNYYVVDKFIELAKNVKNILKNNTKVTYAADWSEYHHNSKGHYNLDKLWASDYIDIIAIDAYFPLSEKNTSIYDEEEIIKGWTSGEGYDFYYENSTNKTSPKPLNPEWAWKNIEYFWSNYHYNEDGSKTEWIPKSKKIWFTEYGFPSVDCCTNQPNVFYSPTSSESAFPFLSQGSIDFKAQNKAILATEKKWLNSEMIELKFLYCWDARPYPAFPALSNFWSDYNTWRFSHALNGKVGNQEIQTLINYLCKKSGLNEEDFDTSQISNSITGYVIDRKSSILDHIRNLSIAFDFDISMDSGKLIFKNKKEAQVYEINEDEIILNKNNYTTESKVVNLEKIPNIVEVLFIDIENNYTIGSVNVKKENNLQENENIYSIKIPIAITKNEAIKIGWRILETFVIEFKYYKVILPSKFLYLRNLDFVKIINTKEKNESYLFQIENITFKEDLSIEIEGFSKNENFSYVNFETDKIEQINFQKPQFIPDTNFKILDLPSFLNESTVNEISIFLPISSKEEKWQGCNIYISEDNEKNYKLISTQDKLNTIGNVISDIENQTEASPFFIDKVNKIVVIAFGRINFSNITEEDFNSLKQIALIGNEIIAFQNFNQIEENKFEIFNLRRGLFNTEEYINNHNNGEDFILLDENILKIKLPISYIGKQFFVKAVSFYQNIENVKSENITIKGNSIKNFKPLSILKNLELNGDIFLSWYPRNKFKKPKDLDIIINNRQYKLSLYKEGNLIKKINLSENFYLYKFEDQKQDQVNYQNIEFEIEEKIIV